MMVHGDGTVQHQSMGPTLFITLMVFGIMVVLPTQFLLNPWLTLVNSMELGIGSWDGTVLFWDIHSTG